MPRTLGLLACLWASPALAFGAPYCMPHSAFVSELENDGLKAAFTMLVDDRPAAVFLGPDGAMVMISEPFDGVSCLIVVGHGFSPYRVGEPLAVPVVPGKGA